MSNRFTELLLPIVISAACSLATTAFFTGQYVQQILSNTDRIVVLEREGDAMENVMYSVKEDSAVNREMLEWIKSALEKRALNN